MTVRADREAPGDYDARMPWPRSAPQYQLNVVGADEVNAAMSAIIASCERARRSHEKPAGTGCRNCGNPAPGERCRYCGVTQ